MRLTLRTLLAHLDGNLEPDDSQDIGKKIEESEFATKLVHLIRDCTRRLRLGAPPLIGRGLGSDPNTVAEYLEYRLPDERVPEFERICLESETHLAEVASCHQILTLVLGEPAEIDPHTRERLYSLAAHVDAPPIVGDVAQPAAKTASAIPPAPPVRRPKPEVPEYLRENRWSMWPVAALVLIAATLTFAGLFVFGPAHWRERAAALLPATQQDAVPEPAEPAAKASEDDEFPAEPSGPDDTPATTPAAEPGVVVPENPSDADPEAPPDPDSPTDTPRESPSEPADPVPTPDLPTEPPDDAAGTPEPAPTTSESPTTDKPPAAVTEPAAAAPAPTPAEGFGRFTSKREVMLRLDSDRGDWLRLPATSPLDKGDRLLSLPSFRPTITLTSNITIQADGPALFQLEGWTDDGVPIINVEYGRLLMLTIGKAGNSLQLKFDGHEPLLTFVDAESTLAVEVRRDPSPGKDPEEAPAPLSVDVYATSGLIRVTDPDAEAPIELQAPAQRSLTRTPVEKPADADFPAWVTSEEQSDYDRLATSQLDGYLNVTNPAGLQLRELSDDEHKLGRRREVRSLAIRGLMYLGDFEPCVQAMHEENERLFWPTAMDELRAAVTRNPQTAAQVRIAFEKERGAQEGAALYRILWGYTTAQLKDGAQLDLVEGLNSDLLDMRVLSFLTLKDLTGTGATYGYRPDDQEIKRRAGYNSWKQRIGKIVSRAAGSPGKDSSPPER